MDPLTWAYLALLAAGTAAQQQAVRKVDKETTKAQIENRKVREKRERDSESLAQSTKDTLVGSKDKEAQRAKELAAQYTVAQTEAQPTGTPGEARLLDSAPTSSTRTIENANRVFAKNKAYSDTRAQLMGQMDAFGSVMQDANAVTGRNAQDIARNAKSMNDWTNFVLPMRLAAAGQSGRNWSTAGDIMKLAAAVIGPAALSKGTDAGIAGVGKAAGQVGANPITAAGAAAGKGAGGAAANAATAAPIYEGATGVVGQGGGFWNGIKGLLTRGAGGAGNTAAGIVANPQIQAIQRKQLMGLPLTAAEQAMLRAIY